MLDKEGANESVWQDGKDRLGGGQGNGMGLEGEAKSYVASRWRAAGARALMKLAKAICYSGVRRGFLLHDATGSLETDAAADEF